MNSIKNRVQLIGHLGNDPEVKELEGGKKLAKLSIATNETYKNGKGEKVENTHWHNLVAWGKTAELAEKYLKKGSEITIDGKLQSRKWEDKEGNNRYITEVVVNEFLMMDKKN
jgi:single-strand DNA-binding protein